MSLLLQLLVPLLLVLAPVEDPATVRRWLDELDAPDARVAEQAFERLVALGEPAARASLEDLVARRSGSAPGRRWRARLASRTGDAANLQAAIEGLAHPDPDVRLELCALLGRSDLPRLVDERAAALERAASADGDGDVRRRAVQALGELDADPPLRALNRLIDALPSPERRFAAVTLAGSWRARPFVVERVRAGFAPLERASAERPRTSGDVLAVLLPAYGGLLADQRAGGETAADRVPLVLGLRHPEPAVRAAAAAGFDNLVAQLRLHGDVARTLRILDAMEDEGFDRRVLLYNRALSSLQGRVDAERALECARELDALCGDGGDHQVRDWRANASYLEALARFAAGDLDRAASPLAEARTVLDGLLAEGLPERRPELEAEHLDWLLLRARAELLEAARTVAARVRAGEEPAGGLDAEDLALLERMRTLHALAIEAQLFAVEHDRAARDDLDALLEGDLGAVSLLIEARSLAGWTVDERIATVTWLGRALRAVVPAELPGFEPLTTRADVLALLTGLASEAELEKLADDDQVVRARGRALGLTDPFQDSELRTPLIAACRDAWRASAEREFTKLQDARETRDPDEESERELEAAWRLLVFVRNRELEDLRSPSTLALRTSVMLREAGSRPREARALVERMRADLEQDGTLQGSIQGMQIAAQIDIAIGSALMEEGAPRRAEVELEKAVERLEEFERLGAERGFPPAALAPIRARRSTTLVSLAVNANVKLHEPERALAYFERAWELRKDDFMTVLLACYRARSGEGEAARRLLRSVRPAPDLFYNMACTYALLGDADEALRWLQRELEENHADEASRAKQEAWAREDPDLVSLRGDPRFDALTGH